MTSSTVRPLRGCKVAVTRERPGELGRLLTERGAEVHHIALIEVVDAADDGRALDAALADLESVDWVLVTSPSGAERVAALLGDQHEAVRLGCVGTATAARWEALTGRPADLVPDRQLAASLAAALIDRHRGDEPQRVVIAQADRAAPTLADDLRRAGHDVVAVTAYRTLVRQPSNSELDRLSGLDAVLFASGSAATGWVAAFGADRARSLLPPIVVAIGPTTEVSARESGLKISHVAADHSVPGIVNALETAWWEHRRG